MEKKNILVVDDSKINLTIVKQALADYQVTPVLSGSQALKFLERKTPDLILLDVNMPDMDGRETLKRIRSQEHLRQIPVIFLTADNSPETEVECLELGAEDYIAKPFVPSVMCQRISRVLELWELRHDLENQLVQRTRQMEAVTVQSVTAIAYAIDARDQYTHGHSVRVANCSVEIAKRLNWSSEALQNLFYAALLHDVGKIGVPDSILHKPSSLTDEEMAVMRMHTLTGGEILKDIKSIRHMEDGARYHHERYDGSGYPYGLKGEGIPLIARIIGVADAYDAMNSDRAYRKRRSREQIEQEIQKGRGTQFDPTLADLFLEMLHEGYGLEKASGHGGEKRERGLLIHNMMQAGRKEPDDSFVPDTLTGLHGKTYARERIQHYLARKGPECTVFLISVDHLPYIEKTFGHIYRDTILRDAARLFSDLEQESFCARISGEEFLVFFEKGPGAWMFSWAQDFLQKARRHFQESLGEQAVSMSIGITEGTKEGWTFDELYRQADKALYCAKQSGQWKYHAFCLEAEPGSVMDVEADEELLRKLVDGRQPVLPKPVQTELQELQDIQECLCRCADRRQQLVQMALMTVSDTEHGGKSDPRLIDEAMEMLEDAVSASIRSMDTFSRYSSCQLVLVLANTNIENGKNVLERIARRFRENYPSKRIHLTYHIQELSPDEAKAGNETDKRG